MSRISDHPGRPTAGKILVAVSEPTLHPEAIHVAAATGRGVIDSGDPRDIARYHHSVSALLVDAETAPALCDLPRRDRVYLLASDPGPPDWRAAMRCHATEAFVLPAQAPELLAALGRTDVDVEHHGARAHVIGVAGVCGGAGASTFALAFARRAGASVLVDAVPHSGGIDLLAGIEDLSGLRWGDASFGSGAVDVEDLVSALPSTRDGIAILTSARSLAVGESGLESIEVTGVLNSLRAREAVAVVDLPSGGGWDKEVLECLDHLALVVPAEVRAVSAAAQVLPICRTAGIGVSILLRHRGWSGMDVNDVERILDVDVVAELGTVSRLPKQVELGGLPATLPSILVTAADAVRAEAGIGDTHTSSRRRK